MSAKEPSKSAPIGIIDSGVGGLSFLRLLRSSQPVEDLIYIADSAYLPYGALSIEQIKYRVLLLGRFLIEKGVKAIVIACNTATAAGIDTLRLESSIPIVGVEPPIKPAVGSSKRKVVGIWATPATVQSDRFKRLVTTYESQARFIIQSCHGLAEAIERNSPLVSDLIENYLNYILSEKADTLVLGCTHYELVTAEIYRSAHEAITIVEPSSGALRQLMKLLDGLDLENEKTQKGFLKLYSTGDAERFLSLASPWLAESESFAIQAEKAVI